MTASILQKEIIKLAPLNWWWVSLIFLLVSPSWHSKKPEAWMCIRCRERDGVLRGPGALLFCFCLCFFCPFPFSPTLTIPHAHSHPGHPSVCDSSRDCMEVKPWGKGPSCSHRKLWSQEHMENPSGFFLSVLFLLGVEGKHSCRNAQQSKYTKDHLSGPRARRVIPVSWKVVQSLQREERLRKKPHIRVFDS